MKQQVVLFQYDDSDGAMRLSDFLANFEGLPRDAMVKLKYDYSSDSCDCALYVTREETDDEETAREAETSNALKRHQEAQQARELATDLEQYERLKAKFGG